MASTVEVHIDELKDAVSKVDTLAGSISSQRARAQGASPISLPSLSEASNIARAGTWLTDQKPFLQGLVDIAILLDGDGNGQATFDVTTTMEGVEQMIGETLAEQSEDVSPYDAESYEEYSEIFQRWVDSDQAMSTFYTTMGPEGTLRFMSYMAEDVEGMENAPDHDTQQQLLDSLRDGLETASNAPTGMFDGEEFASGLVDEATIDPEELVGRGPYNPSGALAFLLNNGTYGQPFLETVATDLDQYERIDMDGAPHLWGYRPDQGIDFGSFMPHEDAMTSDNLDPMTALMSAMEHDPEYALEFFSDESHPEGISHRSHYYLNQRSWDQDGFDAITGVLDAATTDPDIIGDPESPQAHDAAVLASRTVEYFSEREDPDAMIERMQQTGSDGPENLAHILGTYMHGVDQAIANNQQDDVVPGAGNIYSDAFGATIPNVPSFDLPGLETFSLMAMASDEGFAELRAGLNEYRATNLGALADGVAQEGDSGAALQTGIQNDANLEGFFIRQLGDDRIAEGAEQDARIEAWVETGSEIVDLLPLPGASKLGEGVASDIYSAIGDRAKGDGQDAILDALANNEGEAVSSSTALANETLIQQQYAVAALLDERDLAANPGGMSELTRPNGDLISWDDLNELSDTERAQVLSEVYSVDLGVGEHFNRQDYEEAYSSQFQDWFDTAKAED